MCPEYDTKQSHGEFPVILEFGGIRSTPSLPSLQDPLLHEVVAPDKGHIYGLNRNNPSFKLTVCFLCFHIYAKMSCLK